MDTRSQDSTLLLFLRNQNTSNKPHHRRTNTRSSRTLLSLVWDPVEPLVVNSLRTRNRNNPCNSRTRNNLCSKVTRNKGMSSRLHRISMDSRIGMMLAVLLVRMGMVLLPVEISGPR